MNKQAMFATEIAFIENEKLRDFVKYAIDKIPAYFWEIGASASGKFHPVMSQGKGGLIRHTKAVCWMFQELSRMSCYGYQPPMFLDYGRIACIFHDCCKYGSNDVMIDKETNKKAHNDAYAAHGHAAAEWLDERWKEFFGENAPCYLLAAIRAHMGQWTPEKYREQGEKMYTTLDRQVHLADYMASRAFVDIPAITEEYNAAEAM